VKKLIWTVLLAALSSATALADGNQYQMRVDGLACPYCAYGIEKHLRKIDGVEDIVVDLDNGLVTVDVAAGVTLTEEQMVKLFNDSGFTYRSMLVVPLDETKAP